MNQFFDSARYLLIPRGADALLYADGKYKVPANAAARFGRVRYITVIGGTAAAKYAGAIDFEHGNAAYNHTNLVNFCKERLDMDTRARVYCNRSDLPTAYELVGHMPNVKWWIATLDNEQRTAAQVIHLVNGRVSLDDLWALQWHNQPEYDESELFGTW